MTEITATEPLEQKRFTITKDSLEMMKKMKASLKTLQERSPYIMGISFFGSRTKGKEGSNSDIDVRLLYDRSKLGPYDAEDEAYGFREIRNELGETANVTIDREGWAYDISEQATQQDINTFVLFTDGLTGGGIQETDMVDRLLENPLVQRLFSRFFLAIGDGVYRNRQFVLDQFKQVSNGEYYFQLIMRSMAQFERSHGKRNYPVPKFEGYPKTIAEAEKYFMTKQNST